MKWVNAIFLIVSVAIMFFLAYSILSLSITYSIEDAEHYLETLLAYMKMFLFYVVINAVYLCTLFITIYKNEKLIP